MPDILLLGCQGQVGQELQTSLQPLGRIITWNRQSLDLTDTDHIRTQILEIKPQIIVNAAAYTAVDRAETEPELAHAINAKAPTTLAEITDQLGAMLVHISTDYVFDGLQSSPYIESDKTNPQSVYGDSKWQGEQGIRQACEQHIILRTAWVYGQYGKGNFVKTMLRLGAEREELRVVDDQIGTPTWAQDIGDAIASLIRHRLTTDPNQNTDFYGTYHFTNRGVASWYDLAVAIFDEAAALGLPLKVRQVIPIPTSEYPLPAPRPAYSVLNNRKITPLLGQTAPHWRQSLGQMLQGLSS